MPKGQVSDIFTNITKVNYIMQIADFLKVSMESRGTRRFTKPSQTNGYLVIYDLNSSGMKQM